MGACGGVCLSRRLVNVFGAGYVSFFLAVLEICVVGWFWGGGFFFVCWASPFVVVIEGQDGGQSRLCVQRRMNKQKTKDNVPRTNSFQSLTYRGDATTTQCQKHTGSL